MLEFVLKFKITFLDSFVTVAMIGQPKKSDGSNLITKELSDFYSFLKQSKDLDNLLQITFRKFYCILDPGEKCEICYRDASGNYDYKYFFIDEKAYYNSYLAKIKELIKEEISKIFIFLINLSRLISEKVIFLPKLKEKEYFYTLKTIIEMNFVGNNFEFSQLTSNLFNSFIIDACFFYNQFILNLKRDKEHTEKTNAQMLFVFCANLVELVKELNIIKNNVLKKRKLSKIIKIFTDKDEENYKYNIQKQNEIEKQQKEFDFIQMKTIIKLDVEYIKNDLRGIKESKDRTVFFFLKVEEKKSDNLQIQMIIRHLPFVSYLTRAMYSLEIEFSNLTREIGIFLICNACILHNKLVFKENEKTDEFIKKEKFPELQKELSDFIHRINEIELSDFINRINEIESKEELNKFLKETDEKYKKQREELQQTISEQKKHFEERRKK